ncbi:MAG: cytochrome c biogenesis protein CcsA [Myxococcaceae bacterium]
MLLSIAIHAYGFAAVVYLIHLARQASFLAILGRAAVGAGLLLHGAALVGAFTAQGGMPSGLSHGLSLLCFLLLAIFLGIDIAYRKPVIGAFVTPIALAVLVPAFIVPSPEGTLPAVVRGPLMSVHIGIAILGMAAFAVAAGIAVMYLLMERQVKAKRFGLLFSRLPPLQMLDRLNRWLVVVGFIALSFTVVSGAFFSPLSPAGFFVDSKVIVSLVGWAVFGGLLHARHFAGWQGKRAAVLTLSGFCIVLASFLSSYDLSQLGGAR